MLYKKLNSFTELYSRLKSDIVKRATVKNKVWISLGIQIRISAAVPAGKPRFGFNNRKRNNILF